MPSRKFMEFTGYDIASESIFGSKRCFSESRRQSFTCMNVFSCSSRCQALVLASQPFTNLASHTLQDVACETSHSLGRMESSWAEDLVETTICSSLASLAYHIQMCAMCMFALRGCPSNNNNWWHQVTLRLTVTSFGPNPNYRLAAVINILNGVNYYFTWVASKGI